MMRQQRLKQWQQESVALIALLVAVLCLQACNDATSTPTPNTTANTSSTPNQLSPGVSESKVDTILLDLLLQYRLNGKDGALKYAHERGIIDSNNNVVFTLVLASEDSGPVAAKIQSMGGTIRSSYKTMLSVAVPLDVLTNYVTNDQARQDFFQNLASFSQVKEIRFVPPPTTSDFSSGWSGSQLQAALQQTVGSYPSSQGVHTIGADVLQQQGVSGQGMKLGLIDAGFKDYQLFKAYLPPAFSFKDYTSYYGPYSTIHGVASAIVLHQVAPAAQIFAAPVDSWDGFCNALSWLSTTVKVKVVAAVIGWNGFGRDDGSGQLEDCIDQARADGTLVVIAAGNDAYSHSSDTLNPHNGYHQFPNGTDRMRLTTRGGDSINVVLNWDDWEATPQIDLDLYILDDTGKVIASSRNVQAAGKSPWEYVSFPNKAGGNATFYIQVKVNKAPRNVKLNIHASNAAAYLEFPVASESLAVPSDAKGALTVAATAWDTEVLADYSSQGPTTDGRIKPDISGPTDVINPAFATEEQRTFSGTSAATPHVAAAALLTLQAYPEYSADALFKALTTHTKKLGSIVPNNQTGYGRADLSFLQAPLANSTAQPSATPLHQPVVATPTPASTKILTFTPTQHQPIFTTLPVPTTLNPTTRLPASPVFYDNFATNTTGLPDNIANAEALTQTGYRNGSYHIFSKNGTLTWASYPAWPASDFAMQVSLTLPLASSFGGLVFWQTSAQHYYVLLVNAAGQWELAQFDGTQWFILSQWSPTPTLQELPTSNVLQLETQGVNVKISFNHTLVAQVSTKGPPPSDQRWTVGMAGGAYQTSSIVPLEVTFDDFSYTQY
jgi:hypothetical protein